MTETFWLTFYRDTAYHILVTGQCSPRAAADATCTFINQQLMYRLPKYAIHRHTRSRDCCMRFWQWRRWRSRRRQFPIHRCGRLPIALSEDCCRQPVLTSLVNLRSLWIHATHEQLQFIEHSSEYRFYREHMLRLASAFGRLLNVWNTLTFVMKIQLRFKQVRLDATMPHHRNACIDHYSIRLLHTADDAL